jgi:hypothetical protein
MRTRVAVCVSLMFLLMFPLLAQEQKPTAAQQKSSEDEKANADLQKAVQNPVASLISVPLQNNTNFDIGPFDRTQNVLNIQPVIPVRVSENWNVIIRWIVPVIWQPAPGTADLQVFGITENTPAFLLAQDAQKNTGVFGFGDMVPTFFFSPAKPGKLIWGIGPAFTLPTATSTVLGQGKLSLGPSVVLLLQPGKWTLGDLVNNVWSVAGSGSRPAVNQMVNQYFITYQLEKGWYVTSSPIITANWEAQSGKVWTVPFGGGVGRVMKLGFQPVNLTAQFYGNAVHPAGGSPWSMRMQIAFLFPKLSKEQEKKVLEEKLKKLEQAQPKK